MPPEAAARPELAAVLRRCATGELPANVALAQLVAAARCAAEIDAALDAVARREEWSAGGRDQARLREARALWRATPDAWARLRGVLARAGDMTPAGDAGLDADGIIAAWSRRFDDAAALSAEASVALYSLGRADLLAAATAEIVAFVADRAPFDAASVVVEIGCGSGRCLAALASRVRVAIGIDIAPAMLARARRRCAEAGGGRVALLRGSGRDLAALRDGCADLVLAVDVFPYLVAAGEDVAARHIAEARRVLKRRGTLAIFNYAYDRGPADERAAVSALARDNGFLLAVDGESPFRYWDARAYLLTRRQATEDGRRR